ncbi:hypothetical protein [Amycolatopsis sp. NPDC058986]|uniref:hypothetical protein n=2 Tax=Amycolatopsis TaxID=1813 RepID=UPI00366E422B
MRMRPAAPTRSRGLVITAAFLVLLGYLGLHVSLCCLSESGPASAVAAVAGTEHPGDCHDEHDRHAHDHTDVLCAPPRADDGGALAAVPAVLPAEAVLRPPLSRVSTRRRCPFRSRPGRSLLLDLCIART